MPMQGQEISGDGHIIKPVPHGVLAAAIDGLGHGSEAAAAAKIAVATLETYTHEPVVSLVRRCHEALIGTRGVVMSVAFLNSLDNTMTWLGVGNVEGFLLRADRKTVPSRESLVPRGGVLGYQLPPLKVSVVPLRQGDTLIFATDGIRSGFDKGLDLGEQPQQIANRIMVQCAKGTDDALVLVVRFRGLSNERYPV